MQTTRAHATVAALLSAAMATATNIYVAPAGNGDGSSPAKAANIEAAMKKLAAGDSLLLLDGEYRLSNTLQVRAAGSAERMTYVGAAAGAKPILDFREQPSGRDHNGINIKADYVHLRGITIRYTGFKGISNTGSYCKLEMLDVYGCGDTGIQHKNGTGNMIVNCDSHHNFDYKNGAKYAGGKITDADFGGNADGFADKQYEASPGNTYIGCRAWANADDGWDCYQRVGGATTFIDCICYANGPATYDLSEFPRLAADPEWFDHFTKEGIAEITDEDGKVVKCTLKEYANCGNGNGFKIGGDGTEHKVVMRNCLSVGNTIKGFDQNNNGGPMTIYNCTGYANGINFGLGTKKSNDYTIDIQNCVSLDGKKKDRFDGRGDVLVNSHNTWNEGFGCSAADFESLDVSGIVGPRGADGSLPTLNLMRLKAGSKLIDAGNKVDGVKFNGPAPDLGCYETSAN